MYVFLHLHWAQQLVVNKQICFYLFVFWPIMLILTCDFAHCIVQLIFFYMFACNVVCGTITI